MRALVVSFVVLSSACSMCGNDPINSEISPDEEHVAIAFVRNCGATTSFNTQVSVLNIPGHLQNEAGNLFRIEGKHPVSVRWESNEQLIIERASAYVVPSLQLSEYRGIMVSYV